MVRLKIDNMEIEAGEGMTILEAARSADIFIPALCSHPDLPPFHELELSEFIFRGSEKIYNDEGAVMTIEHIKGCGICAVKLEGSDKPFVPACKTPVKDGMVIFTDTEFIRKKRQENLMRILAIHPHSCLTCSQREGCIPLTDVCPGSVPFDERCCSMLGNCELQRIVDYVGVAAETPRYKFANLPKIVDDPLFKRDYNLCIGCGRCVRVCQKVKGVAALGAVIKDGRLVIGTVGGQYLSEAECKFCGSCVEVCPTGALQDKRKPRIKEIAEFVPCRTGCPAEVDIPMYLRLVAQGKYEEAGEVIFSRLPLPSVLGKVCFHPCEDNCKRNEVSEILTGDREALSIRLIKDFAMSHSDPKVPEPLSNKSGKKIAVIGSGPAGLTAAYFLTLKGHNVTIFEKERLAGGMLRYGIPKYRLSDEILDKDIKRIMNAGIKIINNKIFGKEFTFDSLKKDGFDAVFFAIGLTKSRKLPAPVVESHSVHYGVEFLNQFAKGNISLDYFDEKNVVVIGGGNVATDAARTAVRLHAATVTIVCLEQYDEMLAYTEEIDQALEEGISIKNGWGISEIIESNYLLNIKLKQCSQVFDDEGRFAPLYNETVTENITGDAVIICIGQQADKEYFTDNINSIFTKGIVKADKNTYETRLKGIFAGGDIVSGPASVIDAVASGRKAARAIDKYLGGDGNIEIAYDFEKYTNMFIGREEGFCLKARLPVEFLEPSFRKSNFSPVELTFSENIAIEEAARCLQCDLRLKIRHNPAPPEKFLQFSQENIALVPNVEGVIQLLDENKEVFTIKGCANMHSACVEMLESGKQAAYFIYEADPMFTKRESELMQQYLQKHGKLPDSGDDLDDLF